MADGYMHFDDDKSEMAAMARMAARLVIPLNGVLTGRQMAEILRGLASDLEALETMPKDVSRALYQRSAIRRANGKMNRHKRVDANR